MTEPAGSSWNWDPSLYAGSAAYYATGRVAYPPQVAGAVVEAVGLDGTGIYLDVGCGPGSLTLLLAPYVALAIGVDADPDMIAEGARIASAQRISNVGWRHLRAEDLPADLPTARLITFAQSFHWMDRPRVAGIARRMLEPGGAIVHVSATTHWGAGPAESADGAPPWQDIETLVQHYLGPGRRAGRLVRSVEPDDEDEVYRAAGLDGPLRVEVPGRLVERSTEQVMAAVHSLSWAAPHLFADRLGAFDAELRQLLEDRAPNGRFDERMRTIGIDIWR